MCGNMGGGGSSSGKAGGGGATARGAEQTSEYKYQQIIGNGRTAASELDSAKTIEEVKQAQEKMLSIIQNDSSLDQQGKIAYTEATKRRIQEATIRVSPVSNKSQMINFIKQQINIDISNYVENKAGHPRTYLGIHLEKMPKHEEMRLRNLMQEKGVKIGYNGGLGYTLHYIK